MSKRSNGEGTLYKRKDGRWCGAYVDANGKRRVVYGKTQKEAKLKLDKRLCVTEQNYSETLLQDWIGEYLNDYKKHELKQTTFDSYKLVLEKHIKNATIGKMKLSQITTMNLQKYYNEKIRNGLSSKSVHSIKSVISGALEMAFRMHMIMENPDKFTILPKKEKYEGKVLTEEEVNHIILDTKNDELYPIIVTTLGTGMRKGEVMALKWENVDFANRKIYVEYNLCRVVSPEPDEKGRRKTTYIILEPKSKKSKRIIPLLDVVYEALIMQKKRQDIEKKKYASIYDDKGFVFADPVGNYLPQRGFMDKYHAFLKRYDISDIRFHDLRHTFASLLIESDVSMKVVQELMGHSTITTSMDLYTHISEKKKADVMKQLQLQNTAFVKSLPDDTKK